MPGQGDRKSIKQSNVMKKRNVNQTWGDNAGPNCRSTERYENLSGHAHRAILEKCRSNSM